MRCILSSSSLPEEICTLVIAETFPEDAGIFTCSARNSYGSVASTAQLVVTSGTWGVGKEGSAPRALGLPQRGEPSRRTAQPLGRLDAPPGFLLTVCVISQQKALEEGERRTRKNEKIRLM